MEKLTVLYDASCGFCASCRRWLEAQPAFFPLEFLPAGSAAATETFPDLANVDTPAELVAIDSNGAVYRDAHAWIMCLYALREYREWAQFLSRPALLPLARQAFEMLSRNRKEISDKLGLLPESDLVARLRRIPVSCGRAGIVANPAARQDGGGARRGLLIVALFTVLAIFVSEERPQISRYLAERGQPVLAKVFPFDEAAGRAPSALPTRSQPPGPMSQKEAPMEYILWTYAVYLVISIGLTIWVARTLHKNGRVFLVETFAGNDALADSVNHLLVVGFYLINIGYVALALKEAHKPADAPASLEMLSSKVGLVLLVLGAMHFFNLYVFSRMRKRALLRHLPPPVRPQGAVPPPAPQRPPARLSLDTPTGAKA